MRKRDLHVLKLLLPAVLVALVVLYLASLPQSREEEVAVQSPVTSPYLVLSPGEKVTQTFQGTGDPIVGVVVFSPVERLNGESVHVSILSGPDVLAQGGMKRTEYRNDKLAIFLNVSSLETAVKQPLTMELSNGGSEPLTLLVDTESNFSNGSLQNHELTGPTTDISFSLIYPAATSPSVRQGITVGFVALFGVVLLAWLPRRKYLVAALLLFIVLPLATAGFWFSTGDWGMSDWDLYFPMYESYRQSVLDHHVFPLWNPHIFGGVAALGDPEFAVLSFSFLLNLFFGIPEGFRLALYASLIISGLGTLVFGRRLGLSAQAAFLAAIVFSLSSTVLLKFVEGHVQHIAIAYIPWVFWSWLVAYQSIGYKKIRYQDLYRNKWIFLCAVFLSLTFYQGGIYMLFYLVPALIILIWLARRFMAALITTVGVGLWSFGLSAFKLLPVLYWIKEFPDDFYHVSVFSVPYWVDIFLRHHLHGVWIIPNQGGGWHEYGAYIGPFVLGLAILGISQIKRRVVRVLIVGAVLSAFMAAGGPFLEPLFDILTWLPRSNISRIALFTVFTGALLAGFGLDTLIKHKSGFGGYLAPAIIGLVAIDVMMLAYPLSEQAFIVPELFPPVVQAVHPIEFTGDTHTLRLHGSDENRSYASAVAGYGTLAYRPPLAPPLRIVSANEENNEYVTSSDPEAVLTLVSWSPNTVEVKVVVEREARVVINSNYSQGWFVNGELAQNIQGRVGVVVPAGAHVLTFQYVPRGYRVGMLVTLATVLLAAIIIVRSWWFD